MHREDEGLSVCASLRRLLSGFFWCTGSLSLTANQSDLSQPQFNTLNRAKSRWRCGTLGWQTLTDDRLSVWCVMTFRTDWNLSSFLMIIFPSAQTLKSYLCQSEYLTNAAKTHHSRITKHGSCVSRNWTQNFGLISNGFKKLEIYHTTLMDYIYDTFIAIFNKICVHYEHYEYGWHLHKLTLILHRKNNTNVLYNTNNKIQMCSMKPYSFFSICQELNLH